MIKKIILDNGLTVLLNRDKSKKRTTANIYVKCGGVDNTYKIDGIQKVFPYGVAHFLEHYLLEQSIYGNAGEYFSQDYIDFNGITYNYVKRRFYQDYLELYYTPNIAKTNIRNARDEFFRLANDFTANNNSAKKTNSSHPSITKLSLSDFTNDHAFSWQFRCDVQEHIWYVSNNLYLGDDHRKLLERPPQV